MKRIMKKIGILLASLSIIALSVGGTAFAEQGTGKDVQPRGACPKCYTGFTDYICRDRVVRTETGTHKCGLLWTDTCTVEYQYCYSDLTCYDCGYVIERAVGPHLCYEIHSKCGAGNYHVCPAGRWPT